MKASFYQVTFGPAWKAEEFVFRTWLKGNSMIFREVNICESLDNKDLGIGQTFYFYTETKPNILLVISEFLKPHGIKLSKPVAPPVGQRLKIHYGTPDFNEWVRQEGGSLVF